jgi:hypothetical protein
MNEETKEKIRQKAKERWSDQEWRKKKRATKSFKSS